MTTRAMRWGSTGLAWMALLVALAATAWIYAPGIDGPSLLDDRSNIVKLNRLSEEPELAADFVFGTGHWVLGRNVSLATFVLEKLYLGDTVTISKQLNIVLHLLNGTLVTWLFFLLLRYARMPSYTWVSLLAGLAWMLSPLYVSTVLYVVQRMAMLSTFFTLAACISYSYGRLAVVGGRSGIYGFCGVAVFAVLALFSKENAIVLIPILLLMESLWFEYRGADGLPIPWLKRLVLCTIAIGAVSVIGLLFAAYDWIVASYHNRHFSPVERILTQSRVLWDYVGQLYWPDVRKMGLYHDDIVVSQSLTLPGTTLLSILAWLAVFCAALPLLLFRTGRYLVFAIAFFLVGHSVESSILSLELYFEHRNYMPGIGLILAVAVIYGAVVNKWRELKAPLLAWLGVCVLILSTQTSSQVQIWSSTPLLRLQHVVAHPESFRANLDMANQLAGVGELDAALAYSEKAFTLSHSERSGDRDIRDLALSCRAGKSLPVDRVKQIGLVDIERPLGSVVTFHTLVTMLQENVCPDMDWVALADRMAAIFLEPGYPATASANMYSQLAALENALERYDNAYRYTQHFRALAPNNTRAMLMQLHFATALNNIEVALELIESLQALDEDGKLSVSDRQTLSLYLEN